MVVHKTLSSSLWRPPKKILSGCVSFLDRQKKRRELWSSQKKSFEIRMESINKEGTNYEARTFQSSPRKESSWFLMMKDKMQIEKTARSWRSNWLLLSFSRFHDEGFSQKLERQQSWYAPFLLLQRKRAPEFWWMEWEWRPRHAHRTRTSIMERVLLYSLGAITYA